MKEWIPFLGMTLLARSGFAQNFSNDLERLKLGNQNINQMMRGLGLKPLAQAGASGAPDQPSEAQVTFLRVHSPLRNNRLPAGKLLFGKLLNRLVVGGDGSPAILELDVAQGWTSGLRVMGMARQAGTPGRVQIECKRLLLRTGCALAMDAITLDASGAAGLEAEIISGKLLATFGSIAGSFVSGLASAQQSQSVNAFGMSTTPPTGRNALLQGVAQTSADQSKRLIEEATQEKPILIVEPGVEVVVMLQDEVRE